MAALFASAGEETPVDLTDFNCPHAPLRPLTPQRVRQSIYQCGSNKTSIKGRAEYPYTIAPMLASLGMFELNVNTLPKSDGLCGIEMADFPYRIAAPARSSDLRC